MKEKKEKKETIKQLSKRDMIGKPLYIINFNSLCNLSFGIKEVGKLTQTFRGVILQINDILEKNRFQKQIHQVLQ